MLGEFWICVVRFGKVVKIGKSYERFGKGLKGFERFERV
jgi:hypothetical protein